MEQMCHVTIEVEEGNPSLNRKNKHSESADLRQTAQ